VDVRKAGFEALDKTRVKARLRILGILDRAGGIEADQLSGYAAGFRDVDLRAGIDNNAPKCFFGSRLAAKSCAPPAPNR
jgi:hypothetical protein